MNVERLVEWLHQISLGKVSFNDVAERRLGRYLDHDPLLSAALTHAMALAEMRLKLAWEEDSGSQMKVTAFKRAIELAESVFMRILDEVTIKSGEDRLRSDA